MKIITVIIFGFLSRALIASNVDSLNYYVLNDRDTTYVKNWSKIFNCDYLLSTEKSHNKCRVLIDAEPFSGKIHYKKTRSDSTLETFDGIFSNGFIENGTVLRYSVKGQLILSGQYINNWKYGIWTMYFPTGQIEAVMRYIKGVDSPVEEWEYDQNGNIVYYNDEQLEIEEKLENAR